jgi:hypothetical protein
MHSLDSTDDTLVDGRGCLRPKSRSTIEALLAFSRELRRASEQQLRRAAKARGDSHVLLNRGRKLRQRLLVAAVRGS